MSSRFSWLTRIGGSSAVTAWSWILTAPFAVTVMGSYIAARSPRDWPAYFGIAVIVHLVMGAVMLIAWLTVLRGNRIRPRPLVSLSVFAALGACRPILLDVLVGFQGLPTDPRTVGVRMAINVTTAVVALSLIAILVDSVREHNAVMQRLRGARAALDEQRRIDEEYLAGIGRRCAEDLAGRIGSALSQTDRVNIDPARAARLLRAISEDVVRPMSHALFRDVTPLPKPPVAPPPLTRREWLANVLRAVEPAPLVLPAALYTSVILTFLLTSYGLRTTVLQVVLGIALCVAGNWVVRRFAPRARSTTVRLSLMVTAYTVVAVATALGFYVILGGTGFPPAFLVPGIAFYPFAAVAVCVIRAANVQRAVEEQQLATPLGEQSRLAAEVHGQVLSARRRLAHVLHSLMKSPLMPIEPDVIRAMFAEISAEHPDLELPDQARIEAAYSGLATEDDALGLTRDFGFRLPTLWIVEAHSRYAPTWLYRFDYATPMLRALEIGATHATELPYVFGNIAHGPKEITYLLGGLSTDRVVRDLDGPLREAWGEQVIAFT